MTSLPSLNLPSLPGEYRRQRKVGDTVLAQRSFRPKVSEYTHVAASSARCEDVRRRDDEEVVCAVVMESWDV